MLAMSLVLCASANVNLSAIAHANEVESSELTVASSSTHNTVLNKNDRYKNLELFQRVLQFVEKNYVSEVKNDQLIHGAIKGMLETLDPHSNFLSAEVYRDMKIDTSGVYVGTGIEVGMKDEVLTVITPMEDSPAWKAGVLPGDKIVKIDGESTKGFSMAEAVSKMQGKEGSKVTLTVFRKSWTQFKDFVLKREKIRVQAVKALELEPGYGYIKLASFHETAAKDVAAGLSKLEKSGPLKGLVFDLRRNPGGLLDQAVEVSSLFLDSGVVVSTVGRDVNQKEVRTARRPEGVATARKDLPLVVLVNGSTASAAEIVAAALQDHRRAMVVGETTFGKGSVQSIIDLGQGMGLKLTIANYYTPSGASIQEKGVTPDIIIENYDKKLLSRARVKGDAPREKDLRGHLVNPQKEQQKKEFTKKEREEFQIQELKGGQGISDGSNNGSSADVRDSQDEAEFKSDPQEDYQVQQSLKHLKSYDVFKKLKQ